MIKRVIIPNGWPCKLIEAPPGPFVTLENPELLCFKSEYMRSDGVHPEAYNSAGEAFHGNGPGHMVQPVDMITEEDDD
jgi:hypothetical protein